ncbi:MAG TPA: extracellular solute-binding protein [Stellaceae bacterium]|jgi:microcin C transport system substrate-binding protein|nr:extracellular solute-binding protein [Stellaceae bacterium]
MMRLIAKTCLAAALLLAGSSVSGLAEPQHGLSLFGDPLKYPADFKHFDYVNPDAPKGGSVRFGDVGTFDNLNPFILRGVSFVRYSNSMVQPGVLFDSLMAGSLDEPFAAYGLIAQTVDLAPDRLSMAFTLRKEARFHDGTPITAQDVCWTYNTLITKGHPSFRVQLADVEKCEAPDPLHVKFTFKSADDRDLPMTVAGLPVLPEHGWQGKDFSQPTLEPLLGSGPYKIAAVDPGHSITYERVKDYWAKDLPVNVGTNNFDTMRVDYYRDSGIMFEAFKAGQIDVREDLTSKDWATAYDFPAFKQGLVVKEQIDHQVPQGMQGFVFNTRRPIFQDVRVRRALGYLFDFEWTNHNFFYDSYKRTTSYFENSDLASRGLPQGAELALLQQYKGKIPDSIFTTEYKPPVYDESGDIRDGIRAAVQLLQEAGWTLKGGKLVDKDGKPFTFEFLNDDPRLERVILPYLQNLARIGIDGHLRSIDAPQYENRVRDYDFDMIGVRYGASLAPGNDLQQYFGSESADQPGSPNTAGIKDPVIDDLIQKALSAPTRTALVPIVHAIDRVLLAGYYVVPNWYSGYYRVAYWKKFGKPATQPIYASMPSAVIMDWWLDPKAEQALAAQAPAPPPAPAAH